MSIGSKPVVFLSHSSRDAESLRLVRQLLIRATGGTVEFFLSSDGESIPFGRNWVHEIQNALEACDVMFIFASPNSISSAWITFEAGFAYSQKVHVVPVGWDGVDLVSLRPPLSLLQGFNVSDHRGLNNIIAIINRECSHSHSESITPDDWAGIVRGLTTAKARFDYSDYVQEVRLVVSMELGETMEDAGKVTDFFEANGIFLVRNSDTRFKGYGFSIEADGEGSSRVVAFRIGIDALADILPLAIRFQTEFAKSPIMSCKFQFVHGLTTSGLEPHQISAKLLGTDYTLSVTGEHQYGDLDFTLNWETRHAKAYLYLKIFGKPEFIATEKLLELVELLFDRRIARIPQFALPT